MAITFCNNRQKGIAHEIMKKVKNSGNVVPNWLSGMAISTGQLDLAEEEEKGNQYGGQDFRKHTNRGFASKKEKEDAKKFTAFDQNAYGEGDASKANQAATTVGPQGMSFEAMANQGKGAKKGKGGGKAKGGGKGRK